MTIRDPEATQMFAEASETPAVVARQRAANRDLLKALGERLRKTPPSTVSTCARGSSDHAATVAKYWIETHVGVPVSSAAPSIASVYRADMQRQSSLCLAISQSGASPDLLATVEAARTGGAFVAAMVNAPDSPLAEIADAEIPLHAGREVSVAATKSYIASLAAIHDLVAAWGGDADLMATLDAAPDLLAKSWECDWSALVEGLADARGLYVIGRGVGLGVAQEAALKFKETCGLHAEAFSAAEVRHGPMALIGEDFPVLVFRQADETAESIDALIDELAGRGARIFVAGGDRAGVLPIVKAPAILQPMLQICAFYRAANALSLRRGFDPDRPPYLNKVTETV